MATASAFLALLPERRALAFEQAAANMAAASVMVEKDFWVCWLLGLLFDDPQIGPHIVFKGGTSLSKVYRVIDRFSEDIDLSLSPAFVGADEAAFEALGSRTQRDDALASMQSRCAACTRHILQPRLESAIRSRLGPRPGGGAWLVFDEDPVARSPVLWFHYPSSQRADFAYLRRAVKLELGSLTDQQPTGQHPVTPWVAEQFPAAFADWRCTVRALELSRSFWEKATILHAEHHRPAEQPMPDRYARHYADMGRLLQHPQAQHFLADGALRERVVAWKSRVFARRWAHYELARPGSFRLLPPASRLPALAQDYAAMRPMFLSEPPRFDELVTQLQMAEQAFNSG